MRPMHRKLNRVKKKKKKKKENGMNQLRLIQKIHDATRQNNPWQMWGHLLALIGFISISSKVFGVGFSKSKRQTVSGCFERSRNSTPAADHHD